MPTVQITDRAGCAPVCQVICPICGAVVDVDSHFTTRACGHAVARQASGCLVASPDRERTIANLCRIADRRAPAAAR